MIILFVLIGIVSGSSVHTDCYNHGDLVNGRCVCNVGYTGNNCELCDRCTNQGTCHGFLKVLSSADDNDSDKECVCVKDANGRPKYADIDCSKTPTCFNDNDCFKTIYSSGPLCINNLCDCSNAGGWTKGNDDSDKCWYEPACQQCDDRNRGECVFSHKFYWNYYKVSETCNCEQGYYGDNCELDLVPECDNKGYLENGACKCVEGKYGDDCSCDYDCSLRGHGTCFNGACECTDGYQLPDCSCTLNQCSGHGTCLAEGCDCEEGWVNYECSGHGTCKNDDCSIFECHEQFEGEMCHVYKSDTEDGCKQLEHFIVNGPHYRENGVCDVDEYKSTWMSREYNLNPLQSVKLEATSDTDCHKKCMRGEGVNANIIEETRIINPIKFSDNYGWNSVTPDWVKNEHIYGFYLATVKWADNPIIQTWSDFAGMYYNSHTSSLTWKDREEFWTEDYESVNSQSWDWYSSSFSIAAPDCITKEYSSDTVTYPTSQSALAGTRSYTYKVHRTYCTFTLKVEPVSERIWAPFHGKICDATHLINPDKSVDNDSGETGWKVSTTTPPNFDRLCLPDEDIPPYPKYYPRMEDFFVKYDSTHYSYNNGECTCFGLSEDTCGTSQSISYDPRRSEWDNLVTQSQVTRSMPVRRKSTRAYWKKNGDYCMKCPADHHAVPKENPTHCCLIGFEGDDCDININNCDPEPCNTVSQFCVDDKDKEEHGQFMLIDTYKCLCKDGYIGQEVNGVNPCDKQCCIRGATVDRKFAGDLTVHGSCVMPDNDNPGGCECDYGYEGYNCECTDSLCVNGYCKNTLTYMNNNDIMCSCHPGWNVDEDPDSPNYGKCTIGDNKCENSPCVNGECTTHFNDYHCKCPVGFIGKNCSVSTGWGDSTVSSCDDGKYLLQGRCVDCPHGTYSRGTTDTRCRIILTDDNIHDAVDSALNDPSDLYGDIMTFDTSRVTNMDRLFKNKTVPDISGWDVSSVTSMREMFMQAKNEPDTSLWTFHQDVDKFWWKKGDDFLCPNFIGSRVNGRCRFTNSGLRAIVQAWINNEVGTEDVYGPLSTWDVSYVTDMTDLFGTTNQNPDIRDWDMSHVVHADRMLRNTAFDYPIDNKDLSSLNTAEHMMPVLYSGRLCGKHFLRAGKEKGTNGFEGYGKCLTSGVIDDITVIKKAVNDWFGGDRAQVIQDYGSMSEWDVSEVENMVGLFKGKTDIPSLKKWDVSGVTTMVSMFEDSNFNEDIRHWDVRAVDDFSFMFKNNKEFAVDLTNFEIHASDNEQIFYGNDHYDDLIFNVDSIVPEQMTDETFREALEQYFGLQLLDVDSLCTSDDQQVLVGVSDITPSQCMDECMLVYDSDTAILTGACYCVGQIIPDLTKLECEQQIYAFTDKSNYPATQFLRRTELNVTRFGEISKWQTYLVTDMSGAFKGKDFNEDISLWGVGAVTDMSSMFEGSTFNRELNVWNVNYVQNMASMFKDNKHFNQMIDRWNVSSVTDMSSMFENSEFSRPIGAWDLYGTYWDETKEPNDGTYKCFKEEGRIVDLSDYTASSISAFRKCFDECSGSYPIRLEDIEGRNRDRTGGQVGLHYTPYMAGFGMIEDERCTHTCQCATEIEDCEGDQITGNPCLDFERVMEYRDMNTANMFKDNTNFIQPLCGIGWRYRDISSLSLAQRGVSLTCDICKPGEHMSTCGICMGEFRFDHCLDSPYAFTMTELGNKNPALLIGGDGNPLTSVDEIDIHTKVNPFACNCEYEEGLKGCLVVNGRKQVRMKEWYVDGETDFSHKIGDTTQYYCELDFLDNRKVANAVGFNSVECTEDTLLDRFECGLVGGNWNGQCDKCLKACDPPELGVKFFSVNRICTECPEGETVVDNKCVKCPSGKFTDENYAFCGKCPQGTYGKDGDCYTCQSGHVSTFQGAIQCNMCNAGTYSVGTSCESCLAGTDSGDAADFCFEVAFCRHGVTDPDETEAGDFCQSCNKGFKLVDNTCVADCVHGDFTTEQCGENECGKCTCHEGSMWAGDTHTHNNCNYCDTLKYIESENQCHDTPCDNSGPFTDCVCGTSGPVINGNICYDGKPANLCGDDDDDCLCDVGSTYEYTNKGQRCINQQVVRVCNPNEIPHSTDFEEGSCALDGQIVDLSTYAVLNSVKVQICGGILRTDCYAHPNFPVDFNCHSAECQDHQAVDTSILYNGMGGETSEICCQDKETCTSSECSTPMFGQYVVVRNESGMCNQGKSYSDAYIGDERATFYNTAEEALIACDTTLLAQMGDRFVCTQRYQDSEGWSHESPLVHSEECDSWSESILFVVDSFHPYTLSFIKTSIDITAYSNGLRFVDNEFENTCCVETCEGRHADHGCNRPIYGICEGECDASEFVSTGDEPSNCCEADSWYCSGECASGFLMNNAYCGEKCKDKFATTVEVSEVQAIPMSGSAVCEGEEQLGVNSSGCFEACKDGFTNYFVVDGKCFCANNLGGQCTNNITDCSDWCDQVVTQHYSSIDTYFTACENSKLEWGTCPVGWLWDGSWCRKGTSYETLALSAPDPCVESGTCCEPKMYDTYYLSTDIIRTGSVCCDVDNSIHACMSKQCPDRYVPTPAYNTTFYTSSHTSECCEKIPDTHYCDTHNNGGEFVCSGKLQYDDVYCNGECTEEMCCKPVNHYCESISCVGAEVATGLDYCGKECDRAQCCKAPPKCDNSRVTDCSGYSDRIDLNYECSDVDDTGSCADSEYTSGKCCKQGNSCSYAPGANAYVGTYTQLGNSYVYLGDAPMCDTMEGYKSYYTMYGYYGGDFSSEGFLEQCCSYVQMCPSDIVCPVGKFLDTTQHCGTSANRGQTKQDVVNDQSMQECGVNAADVCCKPETCAHAYDRLGLDYNTGCYNGNTVGYDDYNTRTFETQLDKRGYHTHCCADQSCDQVKWQERYEGGRGYDLCGDPNNYGEHSWTQFTWSNPAPQPTLAQLDDPSWIVSNCCEPSCSSEGACPEGLTKNAAFFQTLDYRGITLDSSNYVENCCVLNCDSLNGTFTCPSGYIETITNSNLNDLQYGYDVSWSDWFQSRSAIVTQADFTSTCCVQNTCEIQLGTEWEERYDYVGVHKTYDCAEKYPGSWGYMTSSANTVVTSVDDLIYCCQLRDGCRPFILQGRTCTTYAAAGGRIVTDDNFVEMCCES